MGHRLRPALELIQSAGPRDQLAPGKRIGIQREVRDRQFLGRIFPVRKVDVTGAQIFQQALLEECDVCGTLLSDIATAG